MLEEISETPASHVVDVPLSANSTINISFQPYSSLLSSHKTLVDSGATANFIQLGLLEAIRQEQQVYIKQREPDFTSFTQACGADGVITGCVTAKVYLNARHPTLLTLHVVPDLATPIILGREFLITHSAQLNIANNTLACSLPAESDYVYPSATPHVLPLITTSSTQPTVVSNPHLSAVVSSCPNTAQSGAQSR